MALTETETWVRCSYVLMWTTAAVAQLESLAALEAEIHSPPWTNSMALNGRHHTETVLALVLANHVVTAVNRCPNSLGIPQLPPDLRRPVEYLRDCEEHWDKIRDAITAGKPPRKSHAKLLAAYPDAMIGSGSWSPATGLVLANVLPVRDLERALWEVGRAAWSAFQVIGPPGLGAEMVETVRPPWL